MPLWCLLIKEKASVISLFIMSPHAIYLDDLGIFKHFIHKAMLFVNSSTDQSLHIAFQILKFRRIFEGISFDDFY